MAKFIRTSSYFIPILPREPMKEEDKGNTYFERLQKRLIENTASLRKRRKYAQNSNDFLSQFLKLGTPFTAREKRVLQPCLQEISGKIEEEINGQIEIAKDLKTRNFQYPHSKRFLEYQLDNSLLFWKGSIYRDHWLFYTISGYSSRGTPSYETYWATTDGLKLMYEDDDGIPLNAILADENDEDDEDEETPEGTSPYDDSGLSFELASLTAQLKRNHDYGGNYLDKIRSLQKKRKKKKASTSSIVLGVDIDDTLTDTSGRFTEALNKRGHQLDENNKTISRWYKIPESGVSKEEEEEVFKQFLEDGTFEELIPDESVVQVLRELQNKGIKIVLITARPESQLREITEEWLAKHNIPYDGLFFSTNKEKVMQEENVDFLIDDDLTNAFDPKKVIIIDRPWNQKYQGKRINKLTDLLSMF